MKKPTRWLLAAVILIILYVLVRLWNSYGLIVMAKYGDTMNQWEGKILNREFATKIKSGNLSTDYEIEQAVRDIENLQLNTINIPVSVNVQNLQASSMQLDEKSIQKAKKLIHILRKKKINIILEPYPWISDGEAYETNWKPDDINAFFYNWDNSVLKPLIEKVAIPERVDALCIASNLEYMEKYQNQWCRIVDSARKYYRGLITYKTNWWYTADWDDSTQKKFNNKLGNQVFGKVDYISIAAYFELSEAENNTTEKLKEYLYQTSIFGRKQNIVEEVEQFCTKWGKPVFFGELGFPRRNNAATHPWNPSPSDVINDKEQARCFEAYKDVFTQNWFLGISIFAIGNKSEDKHYYPSPGSEEVIRAWFR